VYADYKIGLTDFGNGSQSKLVSSAAGRISFQIGVCPNKIEDSVAIFSGSAPND
jgi:hypothetical protein